MGDIIRFKKGPKSTIPTLGIGEPGFSTDTDDQRLYIGGANGNVKLPNMEDINNITTQLNDLVKHFYYDLTEVNSSYNSNTPLKTVLENMQNNSMLIARVAPSDTTNYPSMAYGTITVFKSIDNATLFYSKKNTTSEIYTATWRVGSDSAFGLTKWYQISQEDSGWIDLPLTVGSSVSGFTCSYRKRGNEVRIKGRITGLTGATIVGVFPIGFRPPKDIGVTIPMQGTGYAKAIVFANGNLKIENPTSTSSSDYFILDGVSFLID